MQFNRQLLERMKAAYSVGVLTGAGISAASGVPTFRGENGLWNKFRPEELANVDAFMRNPDLVWEWYNWRRKLIGEVKPNLAHYALVDLENLISDFAIITQNVDNLHTMAGNKKVIELHGNIVRSKCFNCGKPYNGHLSFEEGIPKCPACEGLIRPDVVWFGELLPEKAITEAQEIAARSEVFLSVGTSSVVEPAASLPFMARGNGAYVVEINNQETPLTPTANEHWHGAAHEILPDLVIALQKF